MELFIATLSEFRKRVTRIPAKEPKKDDSEMMKQLFDVDDIDFNDM